MNRKYYDYVAFVISDQISQRMYDELDYTCGEVWDNCVEYAKEFEVSGFKVYEKSLYECVQEFMDEVVKCKEED